MLLLITINITNGYSFVVICIFVLFFGCSQFVFVSEKAVKRLAAGCVESDVISALFSLCCDLCRADQLCLDLLVPVSCNVRDNRSRMVVPPSILDELVDPDSVDDMEDVTGMKCTVTHLDVTHKYINAHRFRPQNKIRLTVDDEITCFCCILELQMQDKWFTAKYKSATNILKKILL